MVLRLQSLACGQWLPGSGDTVTLVNPATEEPLAEAATGGVDLQAALGYARTQGGPALRAMTFAERAALLQAMAKAIHAHREELVELAIANGGNTRSDAKFDIDGASGTLGAYAEWGAALGNAKFRLDGDPAQLGRNPRFTGQHAWLPLRGVAVHINAFNFPAWGLGEKAACALLAGVPIVTKAATATALVAHRIAQIFAEAQILPPGVFSFIAGSAAGFADLLTPQDVLAFTGSSTTALAIRRNPNLLSQSVRVNVEADSLNAAILGPDAGRDSDTYALFLREILTDMTQKAGQKCTAIRRVFVPKALLAQAAEDMAAQVAQVVTGDPAAREVRVGPVATAAQLRDVRAGVAKLAAHGRFLQGDGGRGKLHGIATDKGFFVSPTLLQVDDTLGATAVHSHEVFGPVQTLMPYDGTPAGAAAAVALGGGGLVSSIYTDDPDFAGAMIQEIGPWHGRLHVGGSKIAEHSTGPGTVLPSLVHGGPGRAGGGEELGGLRGLEFYCQRVAIQGYKPTLEKALTP